MSNESYIHHSAGGTMFAGPDATELFAAYTLKSALGLAKVGIKATRGFTMKRGLEMASRYSGKKYKRTEVDQAIADIDTWCKTMRAALPETREVR